MTRRPPLSGLVVTATLVAVLATAPASMSLARFVDTAATTASFAADTLEPPTALAAIGGASVTLTWTPTVDTYATGYDVFRGTTSGGPYGAIGSVTPGSVTTTSDGPGAGTWYYVLRSVSGPWSSVDSTEASATVGAPVSTTYATCTTTAADTSGAGDNDGYQSNPGRACANDSSDATDASSGTGGTQSCGTGATPDTRKDRHRFWGFATGLPGSVSAINGIRLRADLGMNNNGGTTNVCAQLSWNGGSTWTTMQALTLSGAAEATYTFGGTGDTWGRTWSLGELSAANFRVRLINASSQTTKRFDLDFVAVSVTYVP